MKVKVVLLFSCVDPPEYTLIEDCLKANVGSSHRVNFAVRSYPPLTDHTKHTLTKNGAEIKKFSIERNQIIFANVDMTDEGLYTISCQNDDGMEGRGNIQLHVEHILKGSGKKFKLV